MYWGACHSVQLHDFYQKLAECNPVPVDPADAARTLEAVLGLYTSAKEDRTVVCRVA